jgi:hypothetical protein
MAEPVPVVEEANKAKQDIIPYKMDLLVDVKENGEGTIKINKLTYTKKDANGALVEGSKEYGDGEGSHNIDAAANGIKGNVMEALFNDGNGNAAGQGQGQGQEQGKVEGPVEGQGQVEVQKQEQGKVEGPVEGQGQVEVQKQEQKQEPVEGQGQIPVVEVANAGLSPAQGGPSVSEGKSTAQARPFQATKELADIANARGAHELAAAAASVPPPALVPPQAASKEEQEAIKKEYDRLKNSYADAKRRTGIGSQFARDSAAKEASIASTKLNDFKTANKETLKLLGIKGGATRRRHRSKRTKRHHKHASKRTQHRRPYYFYN